MALLQLSFRKTILNLYFSVTADNERAVDNFNFRTEDLSTDVFTDIEDFERGITIITDEEIQGHPTTIFGKYLFGRRFEI